MSNVHLTRTLNAPIEKVYEALVMPEHLKKWFAPDGMTVPTMEMPEKTGEPYKVCMQNEKGEQYCAVGIVTEMDKPNRISMTWKWEGMENAKETRLTISLEKKDEDTTEISLIHDGFDDEKQAGEHEKGWTSCLKKLEMLFS